MSDTKIAASFRVSVMARVPRQSESAVAVAFAWLHFHAALRRTWKQEVLRVGSRSYPRRA